MKRSILALALASVSGVLVCLPLTAFADKPTPVEVVNADPIPVQSSPAPPVFVYESTNVYWGPSSGVSERERTISFTARTLIEDVSVGTSLIHQVAGCRVEVSKGIVGSISEQRILTATHPDADVTRWSDGQLTQQNLGRGIVVEPSEEIRVSVSYFTNPDVPSTGPNFFCSAEVQLFGEELP